VFGHSTVKEFSQYFHYSAWGESFVQDDVERGSFTSSYRFNAKELDMEPKRLKRWARELKWKSIAAVSKRGTTITGQGIIIRRWVPALSGAEGWLSVDAMAQEYLSHTPYNFGPNNTVAFVKAQIVFKS